MSCEVSHPLSCVYCTLSRVLACLSQICHPPIPSALSSAFLRGLPCLPKGTRLCLHPLLMLCKSQLFTMFCCLLDLGSCQVLFLKELGPDSGHKGLGTNCHVWDGSRVPQSFTWGNFAPWLWEVLGPRKVLGLYSSCETSASSHKNRLLLLEATSWPWHTWGFVNKEVAI